MPVFCQMVDEVLRVISFVRDYVLAPVAGEQGFRLGDVMLLSRRQREPQWGNCSRLRGSDRLSTGIAYLATALGAAKKPADLINSEQLRRGLPRASTLPGTFVLNPPRLRPRACADCPPFCGGSPSALVRSNHRTVDDQIFQVRFRTEMLVHSLPDATVGNCSRLRGSDRLSTGIAYLATALGTAKKPADLINSEQLPRSHHRANRL